MCDYFFLEWKVKKKINFHFFKSHTCIFIYLNYYAKCLFLFQLCIPTLGPCLSFSCVSYYLLLYWQLQLKNSFQVNGYNILVGTMVMPRIYKLHLLKSWMTFCLLTKDLSSLMWNKGEKEAYNWRNEIIPYNHQYPI